LAIDNTLSKNALLPPRDIIPGRAKKILKNLFYTLKRLPVPAIEGGYKKVQK